MLVKSNTVNRANISRNTIGYLGGGGFRRPLSRNWIPTYLQPCDDMSDFSATYGSISKDTTNYKCGTGSIKLTPSGSDGQNNAFTDIAFTSKDLTKTHIAVRYFIHEGSGDSSWQNIAKIELLVWGNTAGSAIDAFEIWSNQGYEATPHHSWDYATFVPTDYDTQSGGGADWSDVDRLRIRVSFLTADKTPEVSIDVIEFYPNETFQPLYMIRFDDAKDSQYAAGCYLAKKGMVGIFSVVSTIVGTSGHLTIEQLHNLQDMGHLIVSHGYNFDKWDSLTANGIRENLTRNAEWMCRNGFAQGARIVVSPGGRWPAHARPVLEELSDFLWLAYGAPDEPRVETFYRPNIQRAIIETIDSGTTPTNANAFVDKAITEKGLCSIYYHEVTGDKKTKFEAHADYVAGKRDAGLIKVVTPADLSQISAEDSYTVCTYNYVIAASNSPIHMKARADLVCDGMADNVEIQAAIDAVTTAGGSIFLCPGTYTIASSITLKSGVHIEGVYPRVTAAGIPDLTAVIAGGTYLTGSGVTIFTGNDVFGAGLRNLGFKTIGKAMSFGATDEFGLCFAELRNILIDTPSSTGIELINSQHVRGDNVKILDFATTALLIKSDNESGGSLDFQPGNMVWTDFYAMHQSTDGTNKIGIHLQAVNPSGNQGMGLNYCTFIRPQVNLMGFTGTKAGSGRYNFFMEGDVDGANKTYIQYCTIISADLEGRNEYNLYMYYANNNDIRVAGTAGSTNAEANIMLDESQYNYLTPTQDDSVHISDTSSVNYMFGACKDFVTVGGNASKHPYGMFYETTGGGLRLTANKEPGRYLRWAGDGYYIEPVGVNIGSDITTVSSTPFSLYPVHGNTILVNTTSGAITINLPACASWPGCKFTFKKTSNDGNAVTLDGNGAETIDGTATNTEVDAQYDTMTIVNDGSNWHIVAKEIA